MDGGTQPKNDWIKRTDGKVENKWGVAFRCFCAASGPVSSKNIGTKCAMRQANYWAQVIRAKEGKLVRPQNDEIIIKKSDGRRKKRNAQNDLAYKIKLKRVSSLANSLPFAGSTGRKQLVAVWANQKLSAN